MEWTHPTHTAPREPLATRAGGARIALRRRLRRGLAGIAAAAALIAVGLATPPPAAACAWYNPLCWLEEGVDFFTDLVKDLGSLTLNIVTLDPEGAFHDLVDIGENLVCASGSGQLTLLNLIGADVAESLYNNNCADPHGIEPEVLDQLRLYFNSSFESVVIHQDCDFDNRSAITIGEHIYFKPGAYDPGTNKGVALLAHELVHVLQYRRDGFSDFVCHYWPTCGIAAELNGEVGVSCGLEQQAYMHEALVLEDLHQDGDGVFTCALDAQEWNGGNVASHACVDKEPLDNCPDVANPYQADANGNGLGDACDPNQNLVDRSGEYRTPPAASPPTAVVLPGLGVHNIAYRDTSGQLHELWRDAQGTTGTTNLTANANAPTAVGNPFAYVDTNHNTEILLYRDGNGTVRSLYWSTGAVGHDNLGDTAGAPKAAGDPVGYYAPAADTHTVVYRTSDGHLHSLYWVGVEPVAYGGNLTWTIDAPQAAGEPTALDAAGVNLVIYRSVQDEILSVYWTDGPSGLDNLSGVAGTPPAAGDPVAYYTAHDNTTQVVYLGTDGHLWELYWVGVEPVAGWDLTALSGAPKATGTPAAYYSAGTNTKHVIYRAADGGLHEIWWVPGGGTPAHVDLTAAYGAPPAAGDPAAFTVEGPNTQHVTYRGIDNHIYEVRW